MRGPHSGAGPRLSVETVPGCTLLGPLMADGRCVAASQLLHPVTAATAAASATAATAATAAAAAAASSGAFLIRRLVGIAHVADMDCIEDADMRAACERRALRFGRRWVPPCCYTPELPRGVKQ